MRLIDADNLEFCGIGVFDHDGEPMMRMEDVRESVDNAPTIDAVPVVRCKDCARCVIHKGVPICNKWRTFPEVELDGFCSYGERKEGAD